MRIKSWQFLVAVLVCLRLNVHLLTEKVHCPLKLRKASGLGLIFRAKHQGENKHTRNPRMYTNEYTSNHGVRIFCVGKGNKRQENKRCGVMTSWEHIHRQRCGLRDAAFTYPNAEVRLIRLPGQPVLVIFPFDVLHKVHLHVVAQHRRAISASILGLYTNKQDKFIPEFGNRGVTGHAAAVL